MGLSRSGDCFISIHFLLIRTFVRVIILVLQFEEGGAAVELLDKLTILADAAKYDAACTSSGVDRGSGRGGLGSTMAAGC